MYSDRIMRKPRWAIALFIVGCCSGIVPSVIAVVPANTSKNNNNRTGDSSVSSSLELLLMINHHEMTTTKDGGDDDRQEVYNQAKHLLDLLNIRNTCHPTRSDLQDFPLCSKTDHGENARRTIPRRLEDQEENVVPEEESAAAEDGSSEEEVVVVEEEEIYKEKESEWHFNLGEALLAAVCVAVNSLASGCTVGLLSLDPLVLMIKARVGDFQQASQAKALLPLVKQRHLLLVTLLLLNTASCEALPVLLHDMAPEIFVVIISVALMLFFGEILPAAVCIGSNQLAIAGSMANLVRVLMWIVYPVAYPIAKLLDCIVRHDGCAATNFTRNELAALIRLQYEARLAERRMREHKSPMAGAVRNLDMAAAAVLMHRTISLDLDEVMMAEGALALRSRTAADLVIRHRKVFSISFDADLNEEMIVHIFSSGYSRVPVYRGNDPKLICGILMTRQLILVKATDQKKVSDLPLHSPQCIGPNMDLLELVNLFQKGGGCIGRTRQSAGHMAIVCARPEIANEALQGDDDRPIPKEAGLVGIITMEDVLEALLQEQIYDEMDAAGRICSLHSSCSVSTTASSASAWSTKPNSPRKPPLSIEACYYNAMV